MLKVPTYQCSFEHAKTTRTKFLGKHEVPLFRANTRLQAGATELEVTRPMGGLDAALYWASFPSVEVEFERMRGLYGPLRDVTYPTVDDFRDSIETELEKVAANHGVNPNAPKEVVADPAILDLVKEAMGQLPEEATVEQKLKHKAEITEIAIALGKIGLLSVDEIAGAQMTRLCEATRIAPDFAATLRDKARQLVFQNSEQDSMRGSNLDLGALQGRTMDG